MPSTARVAGGYKWGMPIDSCEAQDAREDAQGDMRKLGMRGGRWGGRRGAW